MTTTAKITMINEALVKSGAAVKESAKAEIVNGKVVYTKERKTATGINRIRLTFKEILWMMDSRDAIVIKNIN